MSIAVLYFIYIFLFLKPSNDRNWEVGFDTLPQITTNNTIVTIHNLRDFHYSPDKAPSFGYTDRVVDASQLQKVWFVMEPFTVKPFTSFTGVAHTYFVFDFEKQEPVVVSVEARREKGEKYDAFIGALNKYELVYTWGTEEDQTVKRVVVEHNKLYMYPLTISKESGTKLFLQLAKQTQDLEENPRFYNTFTSNCTNELAKNANALQKGAVPYDISYIFPGYALPFLYKLRYVPTNVSLEELQKRYYISDIVQDSYSLPDFSEQLRARLSSR